MDIKDWLVDHHIDFSIENTPKGIFCFKVQEETFILIEPKENKLFDESFQIILSEDEIVFLEQNETDYFCFEFGNSFYYYSIDSDPKLIPLKYIGKAKDFDEELNFPYLGIHGKYEILNGSGDYEEWCKKAVFLGYKELGICERNTLAGVFLFIKACNDSGIKPILGETITVSSRDIEYDLKLYAANKNGWDNLILINSKINVNNKTNKIDQKELEKIDTSGIIAVLTHETVPIFKLANFLTKQFLKVYYQIDPVEYKREEKDRNHLHTIKHYHDHLMDMIEPIILCDSFYLDKEDSYIKIVLNKVKAGRSLDQSNDQYFKSQLEIVGQISNLFAQDKEGEERFYNFLNRCLSSSKEFSSLCEFEYSKGSLKLPKYEMTKSESELFTDNEDLFFEILEDAFERKVVQKGLDQNLYYKRLETEIGVIKKGNIIDYFLILWDIIRWCKKNDVLTGPGRGSAAGSLVSYLMDITTLDPVKYNLLFERFLNEARLTGELPDIDIDFEGERRDDVKVYMEQKYGKNYVMSIGTYGNMKPKMAIKDIARVTNVPYADANLITAMIDKDTNEGGFTEIIKQAVFDPKFKAIVQKYPALFETMKLCLGQPRSQSIHASATVIIPKIEGYDAYNMLPVKTIENQLVTEWEGKQIEKAGFLKEDILGLKQMDKFKYMIQLVRKNHNKNIVLEEIDFNDRKVFALFKKGLNEDIFQFSSMGFRSYCKELLPDSIEDLIAGNALYRPGPMDVGSHMKYAKLKHGKDEPDYDPFLKDVTKNTYGLPVYQEQTMQMFQVVTDSTLQEADTFRKIITKTKAGKITEDAQKYKDLFIEGYKKKGVSEDIAEKVWDKIISFAGYGFNRSHAACYAVIAYWCQWFKANYPLEFWVTSLKFASLEDIHNILSEINYLETVKVLPPDINKSSNDFEYDSESNEIYFAISSIKGFGEKTTEKIIEKRKELGEFTSFSDFKRKVKISENLMFSLVMSGCFDKIEKVSTPKDRIFVVNKFSDEFRDKTPFLNNEKNLAYDHYWVLYQKSICGLGLIKFYKNTLLTLFQEKYLDPIELNDPNKVGTYCVVGGIISEIREFNTKNGTGASLVLENNYFTVRFVVWADKWESVSTQIKNNKNSIFYANGRVNFDKFNNCNTVYSTEKTKIEFI